MEYSITMALEDFIPVAFSAFGFFLIARALARQQAAVGSLAFTGATLIVLGGFLKALFKLIAASAGAQITWLSDSLFPLMSAGFVLMAWALWCGLQGRPLSAAQVWATPLLIALLVLGLAAYLGFVQGNRRWSLWLLMVTTLGNVLTSLQLIRHSWRHQLRAAAGLFLYNLLTIFLQARLARMEQTITLQWIEQLNNTLSWAAFAVAAWLWQRFFTSTARQ
jgi:hypothetical protein